MEILDSLISATGRLEVLTVLKLMLSIAICVALDTSDGDVCCSLGGLLVVVLDIWNSRDIWPGLKKRRRWCTC